MRCPTCSGSMTPMLYSWFCPRDCDKPKERKSRETVPGIGGPLPLYFYRKPSSTWHTLTSHSAPTVDMTSHVWAPSQITHPIGTLFVMSSGHNMFRYPTINKLNPVALLLRGIDGSACGWKVTTPPHCTSYHLAGEIIWVEGPFAVP